MSGITVTVDGVNKVVSNLRKVGTAIPIGAKDGIDDSLKVLKTQAIENLRNTTMNVNPRAHGQTYGTYTHRKINQSWHRNEAQITSDGGIEGILYNNSDHAGFVEVGTANFIYPDGGKYLKYYKNGQFRRQEMVRGQLPKLFLRGAMLTHRTTIPNIISNAIKARLVTI